MFHSATFWGSFRYVPYSADNDDKPGSGNIELDPGIIGHDSGNHWCDSDDDSFSQIGLWAPSSGVEKYSDLLRMF